MGRKPLPAGMLTDRDRETILAYVRNDMSYTKTGRELYYGANAIYERMMRIRDRTGLDPKSFFDLCILYQKAGGVLPKLECSSGQKD